MKGAVEGDDVRLDEWGWEMAGDETAEEGVERDESPGWEWGWSGKADERDAVRCTGGWSEGSVGVAGCEPMGEAALAVSGGEADVVCNCELAKG